MKYVIHDRIGDELEVEGFEHGVTLTIVDASGESQMVNLGAEEITDLSFAINQAKNKIRKDKT